MLATLSCASDACHSLPGACPLDPLVHMFNPSTGTHVAGTHISSVLSNLHLGLPEASPLNPHPHAHAYPNLGTLVVIKICP